LQDDKMRADALRRTLFMQLNLGVLIAWPFLAAATLPDPSAMPRLVWQWALVVLTGLVLLRMIVQWYERSRNKPAEVVRDELAKDTSPRPAGSGENVLENKE
jgi:hypothetical protein